MRSCVKVNLTNENLIIKLNEEATQIEIVESLRKKITQLKKLYKDAKTPILVTGKVLNENQKLEIKNIIQEKIEVKISFDMPQELGLHGIKKSFSQEIESSQTKFHRGSVRSGQRIEYEGSIVVLGDVNGGAEVIAGDNVVVLGVLRGLAHAGARGNKKAVVAAASIECKQIRIADVIKEIEETKDEDGNIVAESRKTYAYVDNDQLILE